MPDAITIHDAYSHYQHGRLEQAMLTCRTLLSSDPSHFNALNILGAVLLLREEYSEAKVHLARAVGIKPDNGEAQTNLGTCLDALQQYRQARPCYEAALGNNPDYVPALVKLGNSLSREGDYPGALRHYERALDHRSQDPVLHNNCVTLRNGSVHWMEKRRFEISSPVLVDGKIVGIAGNGRQLWVLGAGTKEFKELSKTRSSAARCSSPAMADGQLVLRLVDRLAGLDLRR